MLDVHPAHHAATTWREFFIHIATIILGLLIAIGLEQTVELFHRASERRALIAELHEECVRNIETLDRDLTSYQQTRTWTLAVIDELNHATPVNGIISVTLPPRETIKPGKAPSRAVWSVAKSNGGVALLPANLAEIYDRVDHQGEEFFLANRQMNLAVIQLGEFQTRVGVELLPGAELHLSVADRDELVRAYAHVLAEQGMCGTWLRTWAATSHAVLDGVQDRDKMDRYFRAGARGQYLLNGYATPKP